MKNKKKITTIAVLLLLATLSGCGSKPEEINMTDNGEVVTVDSLKKEVDALTEKVNSMQETIDRYYAGSQEGVQEPSFSLDNVSYDMVEFDDRVLVILKNNGTEPVIGLKVLATFYDGQNAMLDTRESYMEVTTPGATGVAEFDFVDTDFGNAGVYDHVDIQLTKEPYSFTRDFLNAEDFVLEVNKTENQDIMVKVTNQGSIDADVIQLTAVFYQNGSVVGYNTNSMINVQAGSYDTKKLYGAYTYQSDGTTVAAEYDDYEVCITSVYNY